MRNAALTLATLLALTMSLAAQDRDPEGTDRVLTDFSARTPSLSWFTVLDGVMGGRSSGDFEIDGGRLTFTGSLNTNGGGFSSLRTRPGNLEIGDAAGIRIRFRGDGRTYSLRLQQDGDRRSRAVSYRAEFATRDDGQWQEAWLPFDRFVPTWRGRRLDLPSIDPGRIEAVGLMIADGIDGSFRIEVDAIWTYAPFDLARLRWSKRPLLVFASDSADPRLSEQLSDLRSNSRDSEVRDVELIVVLESGTSSAGERPLSPAAVAELRDRFGVEPGAFALHLVGKDGEVKHSAPKPVPMAAVYEMIDAMPMRRAERATSDRSP